MTQKACKWQMVSQMRFLAVFLPSYYTAAQT